VEGPIPGSRLSYYTPNLVSSVDAARVRVERGYDAVGSYYSLTNTAATTFYEVDQDGIRRTGPYMHADGTRFELVAHQLRVRQLTFKHTVQFIP